MKPQTTGRRVAAEECMGGGGGGDSPDPVVLPKGYDMAPISISWGVDGKMDRGPPVIAVPMVCFLCFKLCDHWSENCPDKDHPKSTAFLLQEVPPKPAEPVSAGTERTSLLADL